MDSQEKCSSARRRPAWPMARARAGSDTTSVRAAANSVTNFSGSSGVPVPSVTCSMSTSSPVSPCWTTSGIPPVALATTAAPQAMASRLTMPSGS